MRFSTSVSGKAQHIGKPVVSPLPLFKAMDGTVLAARRAKAVQSRPRWLKRWEVGERCFERLGHQTEIQFMGLTENRVIILQHYHHFQLLYYHQ